MLGVKRKPTNLLNLTKNKIMALQLKYFIFCISLIFVLSCHKTENKNNCPPTFESTADGCKCPEGTVSIVRKCTKLEPEEYYLPLTDLECFDTMIIRLYYEKIGKNDTVYKVGVNPIFNRGGSGGAGWGYYYKNSSGVDSFIDYDLDDCPKIGFPTLGLKGKKIQGVWDCTAFVWHFDKGGFNYPYLEKKVKIYK